MAVNRLLVGKEIRCAAEVGLEILYCVGEKEEEQDRWQEVIGEQLEVALRGGRAGRGGGCL